MLASQEQQIDTSSQPSSATIIQETEIVKITSIETCQKKDPIIK